MKIYTKTGDTGETSLFDNTRVPKSHARIEAYGDVDELNACLGAARAFLPEGDLCDALVTIQQELFAVGARLADPSTRIARRLTRAYLPPDASERLESLIDHLEHELPGLRRFILPGGGHAAALLHVARTVCRRAERHVVALGPDEVEGAVIVYLNRLSDLLFVMARVANHRAGVSEIEW